MYLKLIVGVEAHHVFFQELDVRLRLVQARGVLWSMATEAAARLIDIHA